MITDRVRVWVALVMFLAGVILMVAGDLFVAGLAFGVTAWQYIQLGDDR
jgi:hypothetical protein